MTKYQLQDIHNFLMEIQKLIGSKIAETFITGDFAEMANYERLLNNAIGGAEVIRNELTNNYKED